MLETRHTDTAKPQRKPLGRYLVEAGLVTSAQVETALNEQKHNGKPLGEILAFHGWVEQQTIEYLIEKVVLPARESSQEKRPEQYRTRNQNAIALEQASQSEPRYSDSLPLSALPSRGIEVHLSPKKTFRFLLFTIAGLILASSFGQFSLYFLPDYPFRENFAWLFHVDTEKNLSSFYSASTLLLCSILLATIAYLKKVADRRYVLYWGALSIIFLFLSWDEAVSLHEELNKPLGSDPNASGFLYFSWVIPGAIFAVICGLVFLRFLMNLPAKTRRLFFISGILYLGGAIGMEMVGGYIASSTGLFSYNFVPSAIYIIESTLEEFLEMLGVACFIYTLLSYMSAHMNVDFRFRIINDRKQLQKA